MASSPLIAELGLLPESTPDERPAAFARARAAATNQDREIRTASAEAIAATGQPREALDWLGRLAGDDDVGVRYAAIAAVAGLPWKGRFSLLARALEDADLGIAALAADGLSYAGDRRSLETLLSLVDEKRLQFGALEGLYALHDPQALPVARRLFDALLTPLFERTMAALILARDGDEAARQSIRKRLSKRYTAERGLIVRNLLEADPVEGPATVERIAATAKDDQRETALLLLTRKEPGRWWSLAAETIPEALAADDAEGAAEILLSLADIDQKRTMPVAELHFTRKDPLGAASRRLILADSLRSAFPDEVQLRCD